MSGNIAQARGSWASTLAVVLVIAGFAFLVLRRVWTRDAREPFRYTFFVSPFEELDFPRSAGPRPFERLAHDLTQSISKGFPRRLSLLEDQFASTVTTNQRSHVHVRGSYAYRAHVESGPGEFVVEVRAWVRIGPAGQSEHLAPPVNFSVSTRQVMQSDYDRILDRVYFSVTTAIYKQIQRDVTRKITLLPSRQLRANAYLYEAEDYAQSNTLDAYAEAEALYKCATRLFEPWRADPPERRLRRWIVTASHIRIRCTYRILRWAAMVTPRFGRRHVLLARAQIGQARTLLYRRQLGGISGERIGPVFEAPELLSAAVDRLKALPEDVPDRDHVHYEAVVLLALAQYLLGAPEKAKPRVLEATRLNAHDAQADPTLAFVSAQLQTRPVLRLQLIRAAVELAPTDQVAQYCLARELEMVWRRQGELEPAVGAQVSAEYRRVITLNPGLVAAWSSFGYVSWLLGTKVDLDEAWDALRRGHEYKGMKTSTFVSEVDVGLARVAAEQGRVVDAYDHFDVASAALLAREPHDIHTGRPEYWHEYISKKMMQRFDAYRDTVVANLGDIRAECAAAAPPDTPNGVRNALHPQRTSTTKPVEATPPPTPFVCDAVEAYVQSDHADALAAYGLRTNHKDAVRAAMEEYRGAAALNYCFIQPRHALVRLHGGYGEYSRARRWLDEIRELDPDWPEGLLGAAEVAAAQGRSAESTSALRRVLTVPWSAPAGDPRVRLGKPKSAPRFSTDDVGIAARYVLETRDRRPHLNAVQVEGLVVWARALVRQKTIAASIAAVGVGQIVERWYYPNYPKVQEICRAGMNRALTGRPGSLRIDIELVQELVVESLVARCVEFAEAAGIDGDLSGAREWEDRAATIAAWKRADNPALDRARDAAWDAYTKMIQSNLQEFVELDRDNKRTRLWMRTVVRVKRADEPVLSAY